MPLVKLLETFYILLFMLKIHIICHMHPAHLTTTSSTQNNKQEGEFLTSLNYSRYAALDS